jgi:hypothetical protein
MPDVEVGRSAVRSPCGRYRYLLERRWEGSGYTATFVMLNPSTADAEVDDPTIRRCMGFARSWDYSRVRVINLYALRATDPRALWQHDDPVGEHNDETLRRIADEHRVTGEPLVAAWGANARADRVDRVLQIVRAAEADLSCLGVTNVGAPRHPLYLPRTATPTTWPNARAEGGRTP